jgi:hypothetical protein
MLEDFDEVDVPILVLKILIVVAGIILIAAWYIHSTGIGIPYDGKIIFF